ncbi:ShlB/FhaC/HecB family hemolysin secretion/activation protein [Bradyrhizobium japonicum]|uniref:ShlB/FhaC/HecB family hemolysin secretion/activation protein n=1 Tax=Bradyrhizobium japonicum TaxID=375 RepID=UPI00057D21BA|nr:POTRA domain-containing protein [Bradyrhizobium japonicum]MCD9111861.1 ShlB/FhaC/HecB family hemolysin secretion/activation protein [Bradyrhizobium japonicum]MCD9255374.1 ShlB/FhaC/HecB family hemolysin secretion/activation protein [Bradyrhizobium japonicum SEMIA 5079]MCD9821454.1 ShlB/FhaC/HecB family hemolysin secretion/activation protein [Bradyrhizobium japonicum]MCD9897314.1 ShlB/FhaC/HecB family hemolysin secretion/activation protein [Bradyrhizobium japonicum]MCD9907033.1 ShlB/FhaC/Hec
MQLTNSYRLLGTAPLNYGEQLAARIEKRHLLVALVLAAPIFTGISQAFAQQANQPGFDPRQPEKYFENQSEQESLSRRPVTLPAVGRPNTGGDTKPQFVLRGIDVSGAQAIPRDRIAAAYQPYLGKKVSQADLAAIAGAISDLYRADGFHLSRAIVPPQDVADGRVRIQVIEGAIVQAELKGDGAEQFGVRPMLGPVLAEQPSRLTTLERQLFLINSGPGIRITDTALEEIGGATGRFRLIVHLKTWHVFSSFGLDNLGSSSVGPWQTYATGAFNSYLTPGDTLVVNLSTIANDPRELGFARLSYDAPVGVDGVRLGASVLYSAVRPGDARRLDGDITTTEAFELRASTVPFMSQSSALTLTLAGTFSNVSEHDLYGPWYNDHIRTASLTTDYRLQDRFGGANFATLTYRQGLDIFGASHFDDDLLSRDGAASNFSVLNLWFTRYQPLNDAWSLKLSAASQTASRPLFISQQFYLGGAAFGRGYGAAEISGDNGLAGSLELRFDQKLNFRYWTGYELYAFGDAGAVWNDGYRLSDGLSLTSAGAGVRFFLPDDLQADLGVAVALSYRAPDNERRSPRFLFTLSSAFRLCPERERGGRL